MSYFFGITSRDGVLLCCDRTCNDAISGESRSDSKRYSILPGNRAFLPSGNLAFCAHVESLMQLLFEHNLEAFESGYDSICSGLLSSSYRKVKEDNLAKLKAIGKTGQTENVDALFGGFNWDGTPFIISVSCSDNFQFHLVNKPNQFVCLNQAPEVLTFVRNSLHAFIGASENQEATKTWELAKRFLPGVIRKISKVDSLVSTNGDLIFLTKDKVLTHEFGKTENGSPPS